MIAEVTGSAPTGCPWRTLRDPVVIDVVDAWLSARSGDYADLSGAYRHSLPAHIWEGLRVYDAAVRAVTSNARERERKAARG